MPPWRALAGLLAIALVAVAIAAVNLPWVAQLGVAAIAFWYLLDKPELALAVQFNGVALFLYAIYKLGLEPDSFVTGGFYALLAASYLVGGWRIARKSGWGLRLGRIDGMFMLLYALFFVSYAIFSLNNPLAYRKVVYAPLLVIAPYFGMQLLGVREQLQRFFWYAGALTVLMIPPSFYELLANPLYAEYGRFSIYIFEDKGNNPIQYGIAFATLLLILLFHLSRRPRMLAAQIGLMLPSIYLLVRSGARGPLVSFVAALAAYVLWLGGLRPLFRWAILAVFAVLLIGSFRLIPDITSNFYQALVDPNQAPSQDPTANSIQERVQLIDAAIREFVEHPIIGVGTGNSAGGTGYPHNSFVEVAAEFGLVGLVIFISFCGLIVQAALRHVRGIASASALRRNDMLMNLAFCFFLFAFVEGLFSAYMGGDMLFYVTASLVSVVAKLTEREKETEWEEQRVRYYEQRADPWTQAPLA